VLGDFGERGALFVGHGRFSVQKGEKVARRNIYKVGHEGASRLF
jgi:hypothetical protein